MSTVTVELKNNFIFKGSLALVDKNLNMVLTNIKITQNNNENSSIDSNNNNIYIGVTELFIRGSNIRYITTREDLNISKEK